MPALSDYTAGTITLTNGSTAFTGAGTGWQAADFREGDTILGIEDHAGVEYVIATITGNGSGTLTQEWEGATGTYQYRMRYMADGARVTAQARNLIELLGNGNLQALSGLTGPGVPVFNGPHSMTLKPETDFVNGVTYDVQVDTLADRAAYDGQSEGFAVLVSDMGDGRSALFSKASNTSGDWTDPAYVTGPVGPTPDVTVGTVTTGNPGTPAQVTSTPTVGGVELDFTIPAGEGFSAEGDYSGSTAYAKGDVVQNLGSSWIAKQATTGNAPPTLPTTSNAHWQLLARRGIDGAGTVTSIVAGENVTVDATDPQNPVVSASGGGQNYAINPHFDEWMSGTSFSFSAVSLPKSGWTAEGWIADSDNAGGLTGECTVTREEFTAGQSEVPGNPRYFLRFYQTSAAQNRPNIEHRIGEVRELSATIVCVSLWLRCQTGTMTLSPRMQQVFGSGGSARVDVEPNESDWTINASWERYYATFNIPSVSGKTFGSPATGQGPSLDFSLLGPTGETFRFDMAQFKFEVGAAPTTIARENATDVRMRCLSLFERLSNEGALAQTFLEGQMITGTSFRGTLRYLPKNPGYVPSVVFSELTTWEVNSAAATAQPSSITVNTPNTNMARLAVSVSGLTAGQAASLRSSVANNPVTAYIDISARF